MTDRELKALVYPDAWGEAALGFKYHPKQKAVLRALGRDGARILARCGNEVGKTSVVATTAVLWHLTAFPKGFVVSTAGVWRQVTHQLVPALKRFAHRFGSWKFLDSAISVDGIDRYVGFSTKDDGRFQGFHGSPAEPLLIIIDEAAAVPASIFLSAEERCNPQRLLILGSTLGVGGKFYDLSTTLGKFYEQFKLPQTECTRDQGWWIAPESIERKISKYGAEHPIVLSSVFAEFPGQVDGALVSLLAVERCIGNPPAPRGEQRHAFCDFAAGGDENVLAMRVGNRVWIEKAWRERNTMSAVGQFVALFNKLKREHGLKPEEISGDADGLGKPMVDAIHEVGWPIYEFRGGAGPRFDQDYYNAISEVWGEGTKEIDRMEVILPDDTELKAQLVTRKSRFSPKGKLWLETKDDLRKRNVESPDRADAVLGALRPPPQIASFRLGGSRADDDEFRATLVNQALEMVTPGLEGAQC